jgi:hypothetical protein
VYRQHLPLCIGNTGSVSLFLFFLLTSLGGFGRRNDLVSL